MATSAVALGKVEMALRKGTSIPTGWGMDREGGSTTDPEDIMKGGMLLPLGSDRERGAHRLHAYPPFDADDHVRHHRCGRHRRAA